MGKSERIACIDILMREERSQSDAVQLGSFVLIGACEVHPLRCLILDRPPEGLEGKSVPTTTKENTRLTLNRRELPESPNMRRE